MQHAVVVYVSLVLFNFLASIAQGLTGFGDAVLLHVMWYTAAVTAPDVYNATPLGPEPVRAVTLLMYVRIIFSTPVMVWLSLRDGIFSPTMTAAMAVPCLLSAIAGVYVFQQLDGEALRRVLGGSCLAFAAVYVIILAVQTLQRQRRRQQRRHGARDAHADHSAHDVVVAASDEAHGAAAAATAATAAASTTDTSSSPPATAAATTPHVTYSDAASPYTREEARTPVVTETTMLPPPPLTPRKLSPSRTLTHTRVRVNRNLNAQGKVRLQTKVAASVAAAVSGIMGSLTGVGAPPQIIFVLLFDVPSYIIRVNFCAQSIPSAAFRFIVAVATPLLTRDMTPMLVTSVLAGYAGMVTGVRLGKVFGPRSFNVFVLALLLVASLVMVTTNVAVLVGSTCACALVSALVAWREHCATRAREQALRVVQQQQQEQQQTAMTTQHDATRTTSAWCDADTAASSSHGDAVLDRAGRRAALHRPPPLPLRLLCDNDDNADRPRSVRCAAAATTTTTAVTHAMQREDVRLPASEECCTTT